MKKVLDSLPSKPIVLVVWEDPTSVTIWTDMAELVKETCHIIQTVGFLVLECKNYITVALSYDHNANTVGDFLRIPKRCINQVVKIRPDKRG